MKIEFQAIGYIHTPHKNQENMPRQTRFARGIKGYIELKPEFREGLKDLAGFSHLVVLFFFDRAKPYKLMVHPPLDTESRGLFATRSPNRPNGIGLSVVKLIGIHENIIEIDDVDMLDKTPLLDIKPYIPNLDETENYKLGWLNDKFEI